MCVYNIFAIKTNVSFNKERILEYLRESVLYKQKCKIRLKERNCTRFRTVVQWKIFDYLRFILCGHCCQYKNWQRVPRIAEFNGIGAFIVNVDIRNLKSQGFCICDMLLHSISPKAKISVSRSGYSKCYMATAQRFFRTENYQGRTKEQFFFNKKEPYIIDSYAQSNLK